VKTPGYEPMSLARLAEHLMAMPDERIRWKLVWEFMEEYRWEPATVQVGLLVDEPASVGDERWDAWVRAPAAFRKHGVYLSAHDLTAA
jgi:hypothetical protein